MAVDFSNESPLAVQLQHVVQPKLAEFGWTTGGDDTTLFEYILLMLANDKNEAQVAAELSNDLLDLGPENTETQQFAQWLFEQIEVLKRQLSGGDTSIAQSIENQMDSTSNDNSTPALDTDMEGASESVQGSIPTGPKAMRSGSGAQATRPARGGRMLNQLNKSMNRNDDSALHRVRGAGGGVGRINSHARDPPKGPRGQNIGRGIEAMAGGRGMGNANMNMGQGNMNGMNGMPMGGMPGMPMPQMGGQNGMPGMLNPQQQMALMQMYEQQAQMMQQIFSGGAQTAFVNPNFNQGNRNGSKKPLHQRMERGNKGMNPNAKPFTKKDGQDETMADGPAAENGDGMDVETSRPEPSSTMCKFNLRCTNPDCPFVHQSPAAVPGTPVDMNDTCDYGAACKNKKCVGKHPSPAQRQKFQSEQECAFWPNCRDPNNCPYKHPAAAPCRNGADCTKEGCTFGHSTVMCKFNPCLNPRCVYKHAPGQKKNNTNVWVAPKEGEHVSERKFVDEEQQEELIIPGQNQAQANESVDVQS
ncbi:Nn.00g005660.m01.CDS01 [Neocucurbitaria sp. VM-36]